MNRAFLAAIALACAVATPAFAAPRHHHVTHHAAPVHRPATIGAMTIGGLTVPVQTTPVRHHYGAVLNSITCSPNFIQGQVPSAAQWNSAFACAFPSVGGLLGGPLGLEGSTTSSASFNIIPGVTPSSPSNGDIWTTPAGMYVQIAGATVGPLGTGGGFSGLTVGSTTIAGGTSGRVEYNNAGVLGELPLGTNIPAALAIALNASGGIISPTPSAAGDVVYWNGSAWVKLTGNSSGTQYLSESSSGVPSWATVSSGGISFPQTVAGTTSNGGIPYFSSPTVLSSSSILTSGWLVVGGGVGTAPATTTTGMNVVTTLAAAVNASGGIISPTPAANGDIIYWNGTAWAKLAGNSSSTMYLSENSSGVPSWASGSSSGVTSLSTSCPASGPSTGAVTIYAIAPIAKSSSYGPSVTDCGASIYFSISSAATYTLPAPGTAGAGWGVTTIQNCSISAGGSGPCVSASTANLTITPSSGTINGATSLVLPPGSSIGVITGGANYFTTNGVGSDILDFTASGTWTPNPSLVRATIGCVGGGGGGGGGGAVTQVSSLTYGGSGGGSASSKSATISAAAIKSIYSSTVTITVGAGGSSGAGAVNSTPSTNVAGSSGGTGGVSQVGSSVNMFCFAYGGGGGGGGGGTSSSGGGSGGYSNSGGNATANTNAGGLGGAGGGVAGITPAGSLALNYAWCAGQPGDAPSATTTAPKIAGVGYCTSGGGPGGGIASNATPVGIAGIVGAATFGLSINNTVTLGGTAGVAGTGGTTAAAGNGGSGAWSDGTLAWNGLGLVGGGSGGSGGSCATTGGTGCIGGAAGTSGYGAGGSGGGACYDSTACTGGAGATGGAGIVQILEFNTP